MHDNQREKWLFLPQVNAAAPEGTDELPPMRGKYPCPCCGCLTLPVAQEEAIAYICPVCFWENDVFTLSDDEPSDENHGLTLNEGRANYRAFGACSERRYHLARKPTKEELP